MADYQLKDGEKARTVTTILWVEDLERRYGDKWLGRLYQYLADLKIPCCCSPVHDKDTYTEEDVRAWCRRHEDPDTGEVATKYTNRTPRVGDEKKSHVHIILITKGPMYREDFSELLSDLVTVKVTAWEKVLHLDTLTRYMSHMDDKSKYRYSDFDILGFGGFNLKPLTIKKSDEYVKAMAMASVMEYIEDNGIKYYHSLVKWAKDLGDYDIFNCVTGRFGTFCAYFRSLREEKQDKAEAKKRQEEEEAKKIA